MRVYDGDSVQAPVHVLTAPGNYSISLTVTNAQGSSDTSKADYIRITPAVMPVNADFSADILSGPAPLPVNFTDQSTGPVASWNWSFGDGSFSDDQSPGHMYSLPGNYTVSLMVADLYGSQDTATRADFIRPGAPCRAVHRHDAGGPGPVELEFWRRCVLG